MTFSKRLLLAFMAAVLVLSMIVIPAGAAFAETSECESNIILSDNSDAAPNGKSSDKKHSGELHCVMQGCTVKTMSLGFTHDIHPPAVKQVFAAYGNGILPLSNSLRLERPPKA